jgi:hypothetical protein
MRLAKNEEKYALRGTLATQGSAQLAFQRGDCKEVVEMMEVVLCRKGMRL